MMRQLLGLAIVLVAGGNAAAEGCNTKLKDTDSYQQLSATLECLQKRIEQLEKRATASPSKTSVVSQLAPGVDSQEVDRVRVQLQSCKRLGSDVSCTFLLTVTGGDAVVVLGYQSFASDNAGTQSRVAEFELNGRTRRGTDLENELVADVPVSYKLNFSGLSPEATQLAAIKLNVRRRSSDWTSVTFRGVSLN